MKQGYMEEKRIHTLIIAINKRADWYIISSSREEGSKRKLKVSVDRVRNRQIRGSLKVNAGFLTEKASISIMQ